MSEQEGKTTKKPSKSGKVHRIKEGDHLYVTASMDQKFLCIKNLSGCTRREDYYELTEPHYAQIEYKETDIHSEELTCRICLENAKGSELIYPCKCSGTQKYVHENCLRIWITTSKDSRATINKCEICETKYQIELSIRTHCKMSKNCDWIAISAIFFGCLLVLITGLLLTLLPDRNDETNIILMIFILALTLLFLLARGCLLQNLVHKEIAKWKILNYPINN